MSLCLTFVILLIWAERLRESVGVRVTPILKVVIGSLPSKAVQISLLVSLLYQQVLRKRLNVFGFDFFTSCHIRTRDGRVGRANGTSLLFSQFKDADNYLKIICHSGATQALVTVDQLGPTLKPRLF